MRLFLSIGLTVVLVVGLVLLFVGANRYQPLDDSVAFSSIKFAVQFAAALTLLVCFMFLRFESDKPTVWRFSFFTFVAMVSLGIGYYVLTNGMFDHAQSENHLVSVQDVREVRGKQPSRYIVVQDWRSSTRKPIRMTISRDLYRSLHYLDTVVVTTKPGYRSQPWVVSVEKVNTIHKDLLPQE